MPFRFRPYEASGQPITLDAVCRLAAEVLAPAHFFLGPGVNLEWRHEPAEELSWEIFQGRLLDPAHTRERRTFEAWGVFRSIEGQHGAEPFLSVKLDAATGSLFVVRALECYVHEGYDGGGGVVSTRERRKWVRELTGTVYWERLADVADLRDELVCQVFHAVVGTSRLPVHSVEAPLPAYTFGEVFYCHRGAPSLASAGPVRGWQGLVNDMLTPELSLREQAKLLETFLHAASMVDLPAAAGEFAKAWCARGHGSFELLGLLRVLFNEVSLSPWTDLVDKVLGFLEALEPVLGTAAVADFLGSLLRQTCRHLTAYDLTTFHYRGANYPDALLLDAVLKVYLAVLERRPDLFRDGPGDAHPAGRLRRRALRQAWLLRRKYEGHPVPDLPTSPGENSRVLPPSHPRVPEEQILHAGKRKRRLFSGEPLPDRTTGALAEILRNSVADLVYREELRELGLGLFVERPFSGGKAPAEPDSTILLASLAFSRSLAVRRLRFLTELGLAEKEQAGEREKFLDGEPFPGLPVNAIGPPLRPSALGLSLAGQAAADFVFLRTVRGGVAEFLQEFDVATLARAGDISWLTGSEPVLFARSPESSGVRVHDRNLRPRLELEADLGAGWFCRAGRERPINGLRARWYGDGVSLTVRLPCRD